MRVLIINYDFPPALSGVRRVVKFAKFLPEFGVDPVVVCARPAAGEPLDTEALEEVERQGYPVIRTASFDLKHVAGWATGWTDRGRGRAAEISEAVGAPRKNNRAIWREKPAGAPTDVTVSGTPLPAIQSASRFSRAAKSAAGIVRRGLVPDDRIGWLPFASAAAERLVKEGGIDAVLTSSFPNTAHLVGLRLKRRFPQLRWLADFRDGWTQNPYFANGLTPLHRAWNRRLEANVVRNADAVTTVSAPIAAHLRSLDLDNPLKVHVLPNGFDVEDCDGIEPIEFERFTLAYTGTLFLHRTPDAFFWAVRGLLDEYPGLADEFQIVFRTRFQPQHLAAIRHLRLDGVVHNWGLGTHREALQLQAAADALLVLEGDGPNAEIMLTQKVFEYLSAAKPILAVAPTQGVLANLVRRTGAGAVVAPDNIFGIKERLWELFNGQVKFCPKGELISTFARKEQAATVARILTQP